MTSRLRRKTGVQGKDTEGAAGSGNAGNVQALFYGLSLCGTSDITADLNTPKESMEAKSQEISSR